MVDDVDVLIEEARSRTYSPSRPSLLITALADALAALRAERDLLKAVALRQVQYRKTQVARLTRERDEALAAIERAKALHAPHENTLHTTPELICSHRHCVDDMGDQVAWPCPTARALGYEYADRIEKGLTMTQGEAND